jgi:hypothetical protein
MLTSAFDPEAFPSVSVAVEAHVTAALLASNPRKPTGQTHAPRNLQSRLRFRPSLLTCSITRRRHTRQKAPSHLSINRSIGAITTALFTPISTTRLTVITGGGHNDHDSRHPALYSPYSADHHSYHRYGGDGGSPHSPGNCSLLHFPGGLVSPSSAATSASSASPAHLAPPVDLSSRSPATDGVRFASPLSRPPSFLSISPTG